MSTHIEKSPISLAQDLVNEVTNGGEWPSRSGTCGAYGKAIVDIDSQEVLGFHRHRCNEWDCIKCQQLIAWHRGRALSLRIRSLPDAGAVACWECAPPHDPTGDRKSVWDAARSMANRVALAVGLPPRSALHHVCLHMRGSAKGQYHPHVHGMTVIPRGLVPGAWIGSDELRANGAVVGHIRWMYRHDWDGKHGDRLAHRGRYDSRSPICDAPVWVANGATLTPTMIRPLAKSEHRIRWWGPWFGSGALSVREAMTLTAEDTQRASQLRDLTESGRRIAYIEMPTAFYEDTDRLERFLVHECARQREAWYPIGRMGYPVKVVT
jgi:hypothetical protein